MPNPEQGGNWGILGGSFDPVHNGHICLADNILKKKKLTGVLFIPAFKHPFKQTHTVASYSHRIVMLKLALDNKPHFTICEIEKQNNLSGFTLDTLRAIKKRFPKTNFHFIIGLDLLSQLKDWHRSDELLKENNFLAGSRPGILKPQTNDHSFKNIEIVEVEEIDISARDIRTRIKNGADINEIKELVPLEAAEYIFEKGLYR